MSDTAHCFALFESYASSLEHITRRFSYVRIGLMYDALPNTMKFFTFHCLLSYLLSSIFKLYRHQRWFTYSRIKSKITIYHISYIKMAGLLSRATQPAIHLNCTENARKTVLQDNDW